MVQLHFQDLQLGLGQLMFQLHGPLLALLVLAVIFVLMTYAHDRPVNPQIPNEPSEEVHDK
jgi:hypothetical protein